MSDWRKVIEAIASDEAAANEAKARAAMREVLAHVDLLEKQVPTMTAVRLTPAQLDVLSHLGHVLGRASDVTRQMMGAFDLEWTWPPALAATHHRTDNQMVLRPRGATVPTAATQPPVVPAIAPAAPSAQPSEPPAEAAAAPPVKSGKGPAESGRARDGASVSKG